MFIKYNLTMQHLCCFYLLAISVGIPPPIPYRPFVSVWNVDSNRCLGKFHVNIDLSSFDIIHNPNEQYVGDNMVIFYAALLGLYPKYDPNGNPVNGGIPQNGNISAHYEKCVVDLEQRMPDPEYSGIAVIDWEAWRPLWERNGWGSGLIYQNNSIAKVKKAHPNWPMHKIVSQAKSEFEKAAKNYMLGTLNLVRLLRPKAKWGYYLFPDCYNYDKTGKDLTCHSSTISDNNDIEWLFDASTALFPSTYLGLWFKNTEATLAYVGNRVKEAMRVDFNRKSGTSVPVYVYNNIVYRRSNELLTMKDVIDSSGLASVLGSSGVVFWGDSRISESKETCEELKYYVEQLLGPYMKQASDSATECSIQSCSGHGRCVMSTNPSHKVENAPKSFLSFLNTTVPTDVKYDVCCQCYDGFTGNNCQ
uniref:Hyaluronidase n=1 Tax=Ciona savignyi TaxID=51511 RepID=H2ZNE4_CIOSA